MVDDGRGRVFSLMAKSSGRAPFYREPSTEEEAGPFHRPHRRRRACAVRMPGLSRKAI